MEFQFYSNEAIKYARFDKPDYPILALAEEVGEVMGKLAKYSRKHGLTLEEVINRIAMPTCSTDEELREEVKKELGDVLWQLNAVTKVLDFTMHGIACTNLCKLEDRDQRNVIVGEGDNR